MKYLILAWLCAAASAVYTDVDESLNVEEIVRKQELQQYIDCFHDRKPCTESMYSYKKHFMEAINNNCADCTPTQMHIIKELIKAILVDHPHDMEKFAKLYDPEGSKLKKLLAKLSQY